MPAFVSDTPAPPHVPATTIRPAVEADLPRIVDMGQRFLESTPYRALMVNDREAMATTAAALVTNESGVILVAVSPDGILVAMIGMAAFAHLLSGEPIAGELFFWVEPEHRGVGLKLLRAAEAWASQKGAKRVQMVAPDARVGRLYERLGYTWIESTFQKNLR